MDDYLYSGQVAEDEFEDFPDDEFEKRDEDFDEFDEEDDSEG